jgi:uncharacterized membrane protein
MKQWVSNVFERLRGSLWLVPTACVLGAAGLAHGSLVIDERLDQDTTAFYLFYGGPESARAVLSAIASSMMTFTGLVFSVTILVLQLASSQFSPRVLRTFLRDRPIQLCLGIFVGTFVYALFGLRNVHDPTPEADLQVPSLTVWLGIMLAIVSVGAFIYLIHHIAQSVRAVTVLHRVGNETRSSLSRLYPEGIGDEVQDPRPRAPHGEPTLLLPSHGRSGILEAVDEDRLWTLIEAADVTVELTASIGDFVPRGAVLFRAWGDTSALDMDALIGTVTLSEERSMRQDVAFGMRQIVDVAERALSPSTNDPSTAVQAIDQLHDISRCLVQRRFPAPYRMDDRGALRLILPRPDWDSYVRLAFDEIRSSGQGSVQIMRRLRFALEDLLEVAPPFRRRILQEQLALLDASVSRSFADRTDAVVARAPSPQGHGAIFEHAPQHGLDRRDFDSSRVGPSR